MSAEPIHRWLQFAQLVAGVLIFTAGLIQLALSRSFRGERNRAGEFFDAERHRAGSTMT